MCDQWLEDSPQKGPVMRKVIPFDNGFMAGEASIQTGEQSSLLRRLPAFPVKHIELSVSIVGQICIYVRKNAVLVKIVS